MKKLIPILIVAMAVTAFYFRDRWLPQPQGAANYLGYVEGDTVMIAAPQAGRIMARPAVKGATLHKGDIVFSLDTASASAAVAQSEAAVAMAQAQLDDLLTGKRDPEIDVIRAQRAQAIATLTLARKDLSRSLALSKTGTTAQSSLDQAQAAVAQYEAQIAQFDASEAVAKLAGRDAQIAAARSLVAQNQAAVEQARQKLADLSPTAPADASVDDTFFDVGEWVAAGQPVVSLLPPGNITLRFFVPEADLALAQAGTTISFRCDGCGDAKSAIITHVAASPEYTPPVIYSQAARAKLVYLVEARLAAADPTLRPGLPIEVEPLQ